MEKQINLKQSKNLKSSQKIHDGKICIVHFESTFEEEIHSLTDRGFQNLKDVAKTGLT